MTRSKCSVTVCTTSFEHLLKAVNASNYSLNQKISMVQVGASASPGCLLQLEPLHTRRGWRQKRTDFCKTSNNDGIDNLLNKNIIFAEISPMQKASHSVPYAFTL